MESEQPAIVEARDACLEKLAAVEAAAVNYRNELVLNKERLETLPKIQRIETWLATQDEVFEAGDYGNTLDSVAALLSRYAETFSAGIDANKAVRWRVVTGCALVHLGVPPSYTVPHHCRSWAA